MSWQNKKIRRAGQETRQNRNREKERKREGRERESGKEAKIERENKDVETKRHFEQCDEEKMRQTHKKGVVKSCVCVCESASKFVADIFHGVDSFSYVD